jgi:hypothetical protein
MSVIREFVFVCGLNFLIFVSGRAGGDGGIQSHRNFSYLFNALHKIGEICSKILSN